MSKKCECNNKGTHQYITTDLKESPLSYDFRFSIHAPSSDYFSVLTPEHNFFAQTRRELVNEEGTTIFK